MKVMGKLSNWKNVEVNLCICILILVLLSIEEMGKL